MADVNSQPRCLDCNDTGIKPGPIFAAKCHHITREERGLPPLPAKPSKSLLADLPFSKYLVTRERHPDGNGFSLVFRRP